MATVRTYVGTLVPAQLSDTLYAEVVDPHSPAHREARALQAARFDRATDPGTPQSYLETVDFAPEDTIPIVVRRRAHALHASAQERRGLFRRHRRESDPGEVAPDPLIGTARVDLRPAMMIPQVVRFAPGSPSARLLAAGRVAEIGGFATAFDLQPGDVLDAIDCLVAAIVQVARAHGIERLWLFPRRTLMGLLRADIPALLPPYRFSLCADVRGWDEESPRLQGVRDLRVKGLRARAQDWPLVYERATEAFAADLAARCRLLPQRHAEGQLGSLFLGAARTAQRQVNAEVVRAAEEAQSVADGDDTQHMQDVAPAGWAGDAAGDAAGTGRTASGAAGADDAEDTESERGFLPFAARRGAQESYLDAMLEQGDVQAYKALSHRLLRIEPDMKVLDVGCGTGGDLSALADLVGEGGTVIGLERDPTLAEAARKAVEAASRANVLVWKGDARSMTFSPATFDRARADRVLQHIPEADRVVGEMWRVLKPGGVLVLVEPDWGAIAVHPGSAAGGDDASTLEALLARYRRVLPHALIGRQLRALLAGQGPDAWSEIRATTVAFTLLSWPTTDLVLQLGASARALADEEPARAPEIAGWLAAAADADARGAFFASIPLYFATARKASD